MINPAFPADVVAQIDTWFTVSTPEPTPQNFNTQYGVHVEEFGEDLDSVTGLDAESERRLAEARRVIRDLATDMKAGRVTIGISDPKGFLDAKCDLVVTGIGAANFAGMKVVPALQDVADSNDSKFVDGVAVRDPETQKIIKGPDYRKVDLAPYVENARFLADPIPA